MIGKYYGSGTLSCQGPSLFVPPSSGAVSTINPVPKPVWLFDFEQNTVAWSQDRTRTQRPYTYLYHWDPSLAFNKRKPGAAHVNL
jgi:hypothetical protein